MVHETATASGPRARRQLPLRARSSTGWAVGALRYDSGLKAHNHNRAAPRWTAPESCGLVTTKSHLVPNPVPSRNHIRHPRAKPSTQPSRLNHTWYDRDANRLYADNLVSTSNSELYSYDGLNQLTSFARGTLNGTKDGMTGSASRSQSLDLRRCRQLRQQVTDGTTQTRTANKQNEITSISSATTPTYDANGNMTGDETGQQFVYDAWNRLVDVKDSGGATLATYGYDGLNRRVRRPSAAQRRTSTSPAPGKCWKKTSAAAP